VSKRTYWGTTGGPYFFDERVFGFSAFFAACTLSAGTSSSWSNRSAGTLPLRSPPCTERSGCYARGRAERLGVVGAPGDRRCAMRLRWGSWCGAAMASSALLAGCGGTVTAGSDGGQGEPDATTGTAGMPGSGSGLDSGPCPPGSPLDCYVDKDCGANPTTIVGTVFDPAGKTPLQNVVVFVPSDLASLPRILPGASSCSACDTSIGAFVTYAFTGTDGSFKLTGVPTGKNVPLVVQTGKWRRIITVPDVVDCATTQLPSSGTGQARLPRSHMEGDMPGMALLTGGLDDLGCFLTRMGIAASEYTAPHGGGRLDVYQGLGLVGNGPGLTNGTPGNCTDTSCPLWASKQSLESYDMVLLACEGDTFDPDAQDAGVAKANVTKAGKQALHDWLNEGGKVFATHFHYTWFQYGPPDFQTVANWKGYSLGTGTCNDCAIDQSFWAGKNFYGWLKAVGALSGTGINLTGVADSVSSVTPGAADRWIYDPGSMDPKYLSFDTPTGLDVPDGAIYGSDTLQRYCGRAVFTDLHAGGAPSGDVPGSCKAADLSPQEKALEYLFFDLSACVRNESVQPSPPTQPPK
jgi:hypothetical protein